MDDSQKNIEQLLAELQELKAKLSQLESSEAALRESEATYRSLFERAPNPITILSKDGIVRMHNPSGAAALGMTPEDFIGKSIFDVLPLDPGLMKGVFARVIDDGESVAIEDCFDSPYGKKWFLSVIQPILDKDGNRSLIQTVSYDITEKKKAEEELQKTQKLESLGVLASGIAHDFNNLLAGLFGYIVMAMKNAHDKAAAIGHLEKALSVYKRTKDLTRQLLTFSKLGTLEKTPVDVGAVLKEAAELSLSGSNVACELQIQPSVGVTMADEGQLSQVFSNVLLNARQSMPNGGAVRVKVENLEVTTDESNGLKQGSYIQIQISDQGIGIPDEVIPKVFDPFFTTKEQGSGLGLATSHSIVKKHGGHIAIESTLGSGTTFNIILPASDAKPFDRDVVEISDGSTNKYKILVMDDESSVLDITSMMLREMGHEVACARIGEEAVVLYEESMKQRAKFDLAILDVTISGGMGGGETMKRLLELDPEANGIASSGYTDIPIFSNPGAHGFKGTITKPYLMDDLDRAIRFVLDKPNR